MTSVWREGIGPDLSLYVRCRAARDNGPALKNSDRVLTVIDDVIRNYRAMDHQERLTLVRLLRQISQFDPEPLPSNVVPFPVRLSAVTRR